MMLRVLPIGTTHVVLQPGFFDAATCAAVRAAMDRGSQTPAEIFADGYRVDPDVRRAFEIDVDESTVSLVERRLAAARRAVGRAFGVTLTDTEGPGFLRYIAGGFYRAHQDLLEEDRDEFPRLLSVVLFLTGAGTGRTDESGTFQGGALRLHGVPGGECEPVDFVPAAGTLVAFPAHLVHEVLPVTAGVRDVIVDWFH